MTLLEKHKEKWHREGEHMIWHGARNPKGYARVWHEGRLHNVSNLIVQPEDGYEASHTCDISSCVNPAHLIQETHKENMRRQRGKKRGAYQRANRRWVADIRRKGKTVYLGSFGTEEEAHAAYLSALEQDT